MCLLGIHKADYQTEIYNKYDHHSKENFHLSEVTSSYLTSNNKA